MLRAARMRMPVGEQQPPAMLGTRGRELVNAQPGSDVKGEVIEAGAAALMPGGRHRGRLLHDEVGGPAPPAAPVRPVLELLVAELAEQPPPAGDRPAEVRHP